MMPWLSLAQVSVEEEVRWLYAPPLWVTFLVLLPAAAAFTVLLYRNERGDLTGAWRWTLAGLRAALFALLLAVLFEPVLSFVRREERAAHVLVLCDTSHSMSLTDDWAPFGADGGAVAILGPEITASPAPIPRIEVVKRVLGHGDWLGRLADKGVLRLLAFNRRARPFLPDDIPRGGTEALPGALARIAELDTRMEGGDETHIANAIQEAVLSLRGRRVAAVVVLSDWQETGGDLSLADLPPQLARPEGVIPVMAVGVGSPAWPRDTMIVELAGPATALAGDKAVFTVTIASQGTEPGTAARLDLLVDGATVGEAKYPVLQGEGRRQQEFFEHRFPVRGRFEVSARLEPVPREVDGSNNTASREITVEERKIAVLYIEDPPRWDYRYLKDFLIRDPTVAIQCFLVSADARFRQETSLHPPLAPLTAIPADRKDLFAYDVVILGDVDPSRWFTAEMLENLRAFVAEGGGGMIFLAGENFNPQAYAHTPLADVLPVEVEDVAESARYRRESAQEPFRVVLTPEGLDHPIMQLVPDKERNRDLWEDIDGIEQNSLPGFWWFAPVARLKKGGFALAVHPTKQHLRYGPRVLFACQIYGKGRSFFSAVDSTWRWRAGVGDTYFTTFWASVLRYAAASRLQGETARFQVAVDKPVCHPGDQLTITARVLDEELRPSAEQEWILILEGPGKDGDRRRVAVAQDDPTRPGTFTGGVDAGGFGAYALYFPESPEARAAFRVMVPAKERRDVRMNEAAAREVARATGGKYYSVAEVRSLPEDVNPVTQELAVTTRQEPLWSKWWAVLLVVALAGAEWALRKLRRLL
ncbi:MAG TPA: hypothetical protein PKX48_01215 [Planctomycetota bacterium]|jgi:uncharacterized membrane protein|nr:hypothetical protein [Planctomycetota bacterium]OQC22037.1 MAG: hypothetical protein BWX69_00347 [Planctomycetes bacterium ADurb.Bin069]HNR98080.1 hypothetical protein [Planctomycetota bacterium]HNU25557.1 hypothetical protein [Planctomycetota bacterium]HOE28617.1 hypothetical protein [Planctomycetota bacterium]